MRLFLPLLTLLLVTALPAQPPEYIHYDFNALDATNSAVPGVGNGIVDPSLTFPATLCFGDPDCQSNAASAATQIDTGWPCTLGSGDWSVGMHLDLTAGGGTLNYFQYLFGCSTAGSFRCFVDGAAGNGNIILRGPMTDVIITGGGDQTRPVHVCWVYDSSVPEIRGYLDGVLNVTVAQSALTINGTTNFTVMRYNASSSSAQPGVIMDDFRFYSRAIDFGGTGLGTELGDWVTFCGSGTPPTPTYQVNQAGLSMDIDGVLCNGYAPAITPADVGTVTTVTIDSMIPFLPFDLGVVLGPAAPDVLVLPGSMQRFNIQPLAPTTIWVNSLTFPALPAPLVLPVTPGAVGTIAAQSVGLDPTQAEGLVLSQACQMDITADNQLALSAGCLLPGAPLTLTDDSFSTQSLSFGFPYFGTTYSSVHVGSNGHVQFNAGNTGWASGPNGLTTNANPIIAPCSEDFNPSSIGQVTFFEDPTSQSFEVCWIGVPSFASTNSNSFSVFATAGSTIQFNYDQLQDTDGTVGLGAGSSINTTFPINYSMAGGINGPVTIPFGTDPTEDFTGDNDLSGFQINFITDANGVPIIVF